MLIDNNYLLELLSYQPIDDLDHYTLSDAIKELEYYLQNPNDSIYNSINFEHLIYLEIRFSDSKEVQHLLLQLKIQLCKNYILRKKLLTRLGAYD